jgi:hypothetical protein
MEWQSTTEKESDHMAAQLQKLATIPTDTVAALQACADEAKALTVCKSEMERAFATAALMQRIRTELARPGVLDAIASLQNSAVGFLTDAPNDKHPTPYTHDELRDPVAECLLRGFSFVGNEMNVIARRFYAAKNGLTRKLKELDGLTDLKIIPGIPRMSGDRGAVVEMQITCTYNGRPIAETLEFAIRVNSMMGADAIIGKAERKAKHWLYTYLTGSEMPEGEVEDIDRIKNVTPPPTASPMFKPAPEAQPAPAAQPSEPAAGPDWEKAPKEALAAEIARICATNNITPEQADAWAREVAKMPMQIVTLARRRWICAHEREWVADVQAMEVPADAK